MQLNISTDYALRIVVYLTKSGNVVPSSKLAMELGISQRYLLQVSSRLRDAGILVVSYGPNGGLKIAKNPDEISLYDIIMIMQGPSESKPHPFRGTSANHSLTCVDTILHRVEEHLHQYLSQITLDCVLKEDRA